MFASDGGFTRSVSGEVVKEKLAKTSFLKDVKAAHC